MSSEDEKNISMSSKDKDNSGSQIPPMWKMYSKRYIFL